jgi:hypothetical protein
VIYQHEARGADKASAGATPPIRARCSGHRLASADSMAWSYAARREPRLPGRTGHPNCANCLRYAASWRAGMLGRLAARGRQDALFDDWSAA